MEIRRYKLGEEGAVWSVYFAATHESNARDYHPDLIERWAPHGQDMGRWTERLAQKNPFVATVGDEIVGMAEIDPGGLIDYFYVHPRWQGRGVGKTLLATLESEAAKLGVKVIWADVSITAKEFFVSKGFRITKTRSNVILGHPAPNFRMEKALTRPGSRHG
jgi:putative acetyltransferase